jgi:predicted unusual protein kinase regulating ubiquinone biosynthesis (AarF/ABC1/UbiB family)
MGARVGGSYASTAARKVFATAERRIELDTDRELRTAEAIADRLGNMKGALMKLGQMASYIDEGLPAPLREALAQLQANAPPMSSALAAQVIEDELGRPPTELFVEWDPLPLASASIGQVHRAGMWPIVAECKSPCPACQAETRALMRGPKPAMPCNPASRPPPRGGGG